MEMEVKEKFVLAQKISKLVAMSSLHKVPGGKKIMRKKFVSQ